jgi:glycosyltransferase involved in cell wall biosynthesis
MEKDPASVSVVIPARNSAETLGRVIDALEPELGEGDELILADDRSTDGTGALASDMGAIVVPSRGRPGAAGARNTGAGTARGEWLLFVDSDAVAPSGWRQLLQNAIDSGADAVQAIYSRQAVGDDASTFYKNFYYHYTFTRRIRGEYITGCGTFFFAVRRALFLELGGFDENIPGATIEDAEFAGRLVSRGGRIRIAREIEVLHLREYTFRRLMSYEWNMMRSKVLYVLRKDSDHGSPSVSMARPLEMLPVLLGATAIWPLILGIPLTVASMGPGIGAAAIGLLVIAAGHGRFWEEAIREGGWRGFRAAWITFPDLALIVPAAVSGILSYITGRKY